MATKAKASAKSTTKAKPAAKSAAKPAAAKAPAKTTLHVDPTPMLAGAPYPKMPVLEMGPAVAVLIANIIIPGLGTLIAGIIAHQRLIGRAVAQFLLTIVIVGWVWSIISGVQALINASWGAKNNA